MNSATDGDWVHAGGIFDALGHQPAWHQPLAHHHVEPRSARSAKDPIFFSLPTAVTMTSVLEAKVYPCANQ
nr:hypothetical protein [Mycobacterium uberis]